MPDLPLVRSGDSILPGEAYLSDTPVLRIHAGTQPDLFLRWNEIPLAARAVDVAVHLHGFSQQGGAMPLAEKIARSGLDLTGRTRPTLAILPRGNWIRHTWYDFPALLDGGIDRLVDYALQRFPHPPRPVAVACAVADGPPDELFVFDGLYGRDPRAGDPLQGIEVVDSWLGERFAHEPDRPGALRIVYIERQTGQFSRAVDEIIARRLVMTDAGLARDLAQRYRVEPSGVPHAYVAAICGPQLLARPDAEFDWSRI